VRLTCALLTLMCACSAERERRVLATGVTLIVEESPTPLATCPENIGFRVLREQSSSDRIVAKPIHASGSSCANEYAAFFLDAQVVVTVQSQIFVERAGTWRELIPSDSSPRDTELLTRLMQMRSTELGADAQLKAYVVLRTLDSHAADQAIDARIEQALADDSDALVSLCAARCQFAEPLGAVRDICVPTYCVSWPVGS
jgi:hypothetical protein